MIDAQHGTVSCKDCGESVSAFHALKTVATQEGLYRRQMAAMKREEAEIKEHRFLKAVRMLDRIWRGGRALPCCPHCKRGIYAHELTGASVGIALEEQRRKASPRSP
ncbi:hypothetical protein [Methylobacterium nodulans]|uniref:Uncharacterized protein n=1 Tax=Methylobacterium nodulans (strain LMG 21967 / CNCM I-2342 / ORS 2060) TaxID=460265 RepID=B8IKW2_METNO|nr:hypothetical protein [Methylobacterium nodulans]ACL58150.1 conserved hypothetical protein [Methylobacterium nodulans ORS 2060]